MIHRHASWTALGLRCLLLASLLATMAFVSAQDAPPGRVLMLASDEGAAHQRVLTALERQFMDMAFLRVQAVANTPEGERYVGLFDCGECLIVASGVEALRFSLERSRQARILAIAIPEDSFAQIMSTRTETPPVSAIYMNVSVERMLHVIRKRLQGIETVGIVSGDGRYLERQRVSGHLPPDMIPELREYGAEQETDLIDVFRQAARETQAILAVPDPRVYNRETIVRIMLTTYRTGIPLIGYTESMHRAGALMSVFSSPEMLGEEAGQEIARALYTGRWHPANRHTERYTVAVNQQVARSLRIEVRESP